MYSKLNRKKYYCTWNDLLCEKMQLQYFNQIWMQTTTKHMEQSKAKQIKQIKTASFDSKFYFSKKIVDLMNATIE